MKKLVILLVVLMTLSACGEEQVTNCNESTAELNTLCADFKGINLLGKEIVYDYGFYDDKISVENWMTVIYQNKEFYNDLQPYFEESLIEINVDGDMTLGETVGVNVIYNDGINQEISKMMFVEVRDSSKKINENGVPIKIAYGSFTHSVDGITFTIETHPNNVFIYHREKTNEYLKVHGEYQILPHETTMQLTQSVQAVLSPIDIGFKVIIQKIVGTERVDLDTYYILSNDNIMNPNYTYQISNVEGIVKRLNVPGTVSYDITKLELDKGTNYLEVEIRVKNNESIILEETYTLTQDVTEILIESDDLLYNVEIFRFTSGILYVYVGDEISSYRHMIIIED